MAGLDKYVASTDAEKELIELCSKADAEGDVLRDKVLTLLHGKEESKLRVDATDEHGMTGLMHASYKGRAGLCSVLLEHGADVNCNLHNDHYTALMFATIAGNETVVRLLLEAGAKTTPTNNVGKTAGQLGSFVGQHACVRIINNFYSLSDLQFYTRPQGVETSPKLDPSLAPDVHKLMLSTNLHPVKLLLCLRAHQNLQENWKQVVRVLSLVSGKLVKADQDKEPLSLKMFHLGFVVGRSAEVQGGIQALLKLLLTIEEDGRAINTDRFMRQCLQDYPHVHSSLLKQMVSSLARVPAGGPPSAVSLFHSAIISSKSVEGDVCSTCGDYDYNVSLKHCSKCKRVLYCSTECQKLAWKTGNHRKLCKIWSAAATTSNK